MNQTTAEQALDLNPALRPDYLSDARDAYPTGFKAILADPPYSEDEATNYAVGATAYPPPSLIVRNALAALKPGQRVGLIHYQLPQPPANARFVAAIGVLCGFNNRIRVFSVFEKLRKAKR